MANIVGHLARRGMEAVRSRQGQPNVEIKLSPWAIALLAVTCAAFFLFASSIEYSVRILMGHLAMVESPEATTVQIYTPASSDNGDLKKEAEAEGLLDVELESSMTTIFTKPITTSIRRTARHLKSIGGFKAKFRGLPIFMLYSIMTTMVSAVLSMTIMRIVPFGEMFSNIAAAMLASRMHCAWTHKIISMPSEKKLWERRVSRQQWKTLFVPTAMSILARDLSVYSLVYTVIMSKTAAQALTEKANLPAWAAVLMVVVLVIFSTVFLGIFVMLPAYAALVRKEASMLPEEDETIISFDRSFGGKLQHIGEQLSYKDAWKSFDGEARRRVIKLYVKFFFIMTAIVVVMAHVIGLEFMLVAGDKIPELAMHVKQNFRG